MICASLVFRFGVPARLPPVLRPRAIYRASILESAARSILAHSACNAAAASAIAANSRRKSCGAWRSGCGLRSLLMLPRFHARRHGNSVLLELRFQRASNVDADRLLGLRHRSVEQVIRSLGQADVQ